MVRERGLELVAKLAGRQRPNMQRAIAGNADRRLPVGGDRYRHNPEQRPPMVERERGFEVRQVPNTAAGCPEQRKPEPPVRGDRHSLDRAHVGWERS